MSTIRDIDLLGGGDVPIGGVIYRAGKPIDFTDEGRRYLRSGFIETDTNEFAEQEWPDTFGNYWEVVSEVTGAESGFSKVIYDDQISKYVALKDSKVYVTDSLLDPWTEITLPYNMYDLCSDNNGLLVAVGPGGKIYTSTDAITWTSRTSGTTELFNTVVYMPVNGQFVIGGRNGTTRKSTDGISWSSAGSPAFALGTDSVDELAVATLAGEETVIAISNSDYNVFMLDASLNSWSLLVDLTSRIESGPNKMFVNSNQEIVCFSAGTGSSVGVVLHVDGELNVHVETINMTNFLDTNIDENTNIEEASYDPLAEKVLMIGRFFEVFCSDEGVLAMRPATSPLAAPKLFNDGVNTYMYSQSTGNKIYSPAPSAGSIVPSADGAVPQYVRIS